MAFLYPLYQQPATVLFGLLLVTLWTLLWNGWGLWTAAQQKQKGWFIAILLLNTLGLLPIIYLIWFRKRTRTTEATWVRVTGSEKNSLKKSPKRKKAAE
ncbi:MAG: DUF5652 family protein [Nanoarchaeota archaeon]|nr:DUF5652 family protein [Nanoarchaeota archaeon]